MLSKVHFKILFSLIVYVADESIFDIFRFLKARKRLMEKKEEFLDSLTVKREDKTHPTEAQV